MVFNFPFVHFIYYLKGVKIGGRKSTNHKIKRERKKGSRFGNFGGRNLRFVVGLGTKIRGSEK